MTNQLCSRVTLLALAATLGATRHVPVEGMALILGVDRFMSEARALTNLVGNTVAMLVVARWEGVFDVDTARAILADPRAAREEESRLMIEPARDMHK